MAKISHVDQLLDRWILEWQNALREEKDEVVKKTKVSTKGFEDFAKQLGTDCPESVTNAIYAIEDLVEKGEAKWGTVVNTWYAFVGTNYYQIDHKEFSNISSRLRIIYEGFLELQRFNATDNSYFGDPKAEPEGAGGKKSEPLVKAGIVSPTDLSHAIEYIRRLYITAIALRNMNPLDDNPSSAFGEAYSALNDFIEDTNQTDWEIIKNKHIQVLNGKADIDIQIVSKKFNKEVKGWAERGIGKDLAALFRGKRGNFVARVGGENIDWGKLQGSKKLEEEIIDQFIKVAKGKKPKAYKSKHRNKKHTKTKTKKIKKASATKKLLIAKKLKTKKKGSFAKISKQESGKEASAAQMKAWINRALHNKIMQNMGRPALRYDSGRFARSVQLVDLHLNLKNELTGKYTYMLRPYQTFENTGRWPAGYNPKPLIRDSIRELAERHTKTKIAYLRGV